jgi:hypothetical protein
MPGEAEKEWLLLEIRKDLLHDLTNVNKPQRIGGMLKRGVAVFWVMSADPGHELSNAPLQLVEVNIWLHDVIDADVFNHRQPPFISITDFAGTRIRLPVRQDLTLTVQMQAT